MSKRCSGCDEQIGSMWLEGREDLCVTCGLATLPPDAEVVLHYIATGRVETIETEVAIDGGGPPSKERER